jgi:hypothetical protein
MVLYLQVSFSQQRLYPSWCISRGCYVLARAVDTISLIYTGGIPITAGIKAANEAMILSAAKSEIFSCNWSTFIIFNEIVVFFLSFYRSLRKIQIILFIFNFLKSTG